MMPAQTNINALKAKAEEIIADKKAEISRLMSLLETKRERRTKRKV